MKHFRFWVTLPCYLLALGMFIVSAALLNECLKFMGKGDVWDMFARLLIERERQAGKTEEKAP